MKKIILLILTISITLLPVPGFAATKLMYTGWIPFWKQSPGSMDIALNIEKLSEVSPFSYEVKSNGTLVDTLKITKGFWPGWISAVKDQKIKIIPTIAWFDGDAIHTLLSNKKKRIAHENAIKKLVQVNKFDGIDIDYEAKLADTNQYFALFIEGLAIRLHPLGKKLVCTIESRMPISSRLNRTNTADDTKYANDYKTLNKFCDEVRIMAYDQGVIDAKLDVSKGNGQIYAPVADPEWVAKVITEATKIISPKKIVLGVPTYGYEYEVSWANGFTTYKRLRSHTFFQAMSRADDLSANPERNSAGELSFVYSTSTSVTDVSPNLTWNISSTLPAAIASASAGGKFVRYVSFSDAESTRQKINLAKKLGLKGIALFKLDGDLDPMTWEVMK